MKLKYYLRGLGVGILFSTIILSISFNAALKEKTNKVNTNTDNSEEVNADEEIKNIEELLIPTVEPTKEPTKELAKNEEKVGPSQEVPSVTPTNPPTDEHTDEPDEPNKSNEDKKQVTEETDKEIVSKEKDSQDYIIINILKGMSSEEVALILKNYGIIDNNKDFNNFLKENGYSTNIKVGDFKISNNATYEQIANLIVKK